MNARRVLLTTDCVGGVWTYSLELACALRDLDVDCVLAVMGPSPSPEQIAAADGLRLIDTGLPLDWLADRPDALRRAGEELARIANHEQADVIQLCSAALAASASFHQPVIAVQHSCVATWWATVRGGPLPADFAWRRDLVEAGLAAADAVVAPSAAFAALTARTYASVRPLHVVRNGRAPMPLPSRLGGDFAFTSGRLWDEGKNLRTLDEAAAMLDVPFEAAGPTSAPDGTRIGFDHLVTPGVLPDPSLAQRLAARPIFASAALYEPFGLSVLEAAQAGCTLVLSDIQTFRELWEGAALFVPARDATAFADAIADLLRDVQRRAELGEAAQSRALRYSPAAMASGMARIYNRLLDKDAAPAARLQAAAAA